jgi:membrane protein implicated in regulation of membrane protease activity
MSTGEIIAWGFIIFLILAVAFAVIYKPSEKSEDRRVSQEKRDKEHHLEMQRLRQEEERFERQAEEERSIPSGRGKVFKARRD